MFIYGNIFHLICKQVGGWPGSPGHSAHVCMADPEQEPCGFAHFSVVALGLRPSSLSEWPCARYLASLFTLISPSIRKGS